MDYFLNHPILMMLLIFGKNPQDKSINKISPKTEDKKIKIRLITIKKIQIQRISKLMSHYQNLH